MQRFIAPPSARPPPAYGPILALFAERHADDHELTCLEALRTIGRCIDTTFSKIMSESKYKPVIGHAHPHPHPSGVHTHAHEHVHDHEHTHADGTTHRHPHAHVHEHSHEHHSPAAEHEHPDLEDAAHRKAPHDHSH